MIVFILRATVKQLSETRKAQKLKTKLCGTELPVRTRKRFYEFQGARISSESAFFTQMSNVVWAHGDRNYGNSMAGLLDGAHWVHHSGGSPDVGEDLFLVFIQVIPP